MDSQLDRQQTEIYALKSIYGNDFIECDPPTVWKGAPRLPEFIIRVRHPDQAHADATFFDLHVKLPKTYPKLAAPIFTIQPPTSGLKPSQLTEITQAIHEHVRSLKDTEMVFEAVDAAQAWLSVNVHPSQEPTGSLAAQMARRAHEEEEARKEREQVIASEAYERQRQREHAIEEQLRMNAERLHQARKRAMSDVTEVAANDIFTVDDEDAGDVTVDGQNGQTSGRRNLMEAFSEEVEWQGVRFRKVALSHPQKEKLGTTYQAEPNPCISSSNAHTPSLSLELFTIAFESKYYSTAHARKKLKQLETDCQQLTRLRHSNLLAVLAVKLVLAGGGGTSRLCILHEKRPAVTLKDVLEDCDFLKEVRATEYTMQILSALNAVHTASLILRGIDPNCIGLVPQSSTCPTSVAQPGPSKRVKLFHVAYYVQLLDMNRSEPFSTNSFVPDSPTPEGWMPKDALDSSLVYTRSRDIHAVGIVLLQMLMGVDVMERYEDVNDALRCSSISSSMQQHIVNMVAPGKKGFSAGSLLVSLAGIPIADSTRTPTIPINGNGYTPNTPIPSNVSGSPPTDYMLYRPATRHASRWKEDWQELEFVGKGAFGSVVKARNKLDKRIYAVKKIKLRPGQSEDKLFREVSTLSRLNHRNIVRYYTTWIEYSDMDSTTSSAVGSSAGTGDHSAETYSIGSNSFNQEQMLAIDWNSVQSPSNGHSFPSIHFTTGESSDSDSESDPTGSDTAGSGESSGGLGGRMVLRGRGRGYQGQRAMGHGMIDLSAPPKLSKTLFIQMEYVERQTLKELVNDEQGLPEEEAWRLFRQLVDALVHMASLNILHRDIKLNNIFIDAHGDCKIGDFGLATFNLDVVEPLDAPHPNFLSEDLTLEVGTTLYIAPEIKMSSHPPGIRSDQTKADMYSLGIVFFEMNYQFGTAQERIVVLERLRKPEIIFPDDWDKQRTRQRQIITWLLQHDPAGRPSARELSESPLMPPKVEDEHFKNTLAMIVKSDSPYRQSVLAALFKQEPEPGHTFLYDSGEIPEHATLNGIVHDRIVQIFRMHGAVDMEPPLLLPIADKDDAQSRAAFLDRNGKPVALPDNAFAPFARVAARVGTRRIKRYHVSDVYKPDPVAGHPKAYKTAVFDIITQDTVSGPCASAAESISIVTDCMNSFANLDKYEIQLSHTQIRAALFEHLSLPSYTEVLKILQTNASTSQRRQLLLDKALSRNAVDLLEALFEGGTDIDAVCARLEKISPSFLSAIREPLRDIRATIQFAVAIGVQRPIVFKPLFMLHNKQVMFDGIRFEVVKGQSTNLKRWDVLAVGGRYEQYINSFSPVKSRSDGIAAVGIQISLEKIAAALASFQSSSMKDSMKTGRSYGYWSPRRCDVYVAAHPSDLDGTLLERLEVSAFLWRNGISADMMYEFGGAEGENVVDQCTREGILFIVYPRARLYRRDQPAFKVKSVLKSTEYAVSRHELVPFLAQQIAEQKRIDASISGAPWVAESSQSTTLAKENSDSNVQLVLPQETKKQRRQTKQILLDRAVEFQDTLKNAVTQSGIPIVAVDVPIPIFEEMSKNTSWINDENALKPLLTSMSAQQSIYVTQVRDAVLKKKGDDCKFVILFAVKEERASLLTF
ncbi:hypothetical protein BDY19DRAFT_998561 [Irpex rosettiformis]|uniref:Uncharacterized protein n=1 Tax=Irpex rosettiformis TaxID=378272 RepID=A0ACB8TN61_9APHY|nr:hypothetical protein BDY19DRAFT_998561 [Irpex rosettiformis]